MPPTASWLFRHRLPHGTAVLVTVGLALGTSALFSGPSLAQPAGDSAYFERHIRPILVARCYECHSEAEEAQKGGLLLDRESGWLEGGDSGKAVVPGNLEASLLVDAIRRVDDDIAMPPKEPLPEAEVKRLEQWIPQRSTGPGSGHGRNRVFPTRRPGLPLQEGQRSLGVSADRNLGPSGGG